MHRINIMTEVDTRSSATAEIARVGAVVSLKKRETSRYRVVQNEFRYLEPSMRG